LRPRSSPTLLLTGATGLVGSELLPLLLRANPRRRVVCLARSNSLAFRHPRVSSLEGDLTLPGLGQDSSSLRELRHSVTEIIHCAADTRFGAPLEEARAANTQGTRNLLTLARSCARLEKLAHLSTVYVVGRSAGHFAEAPVRQRNGFSNTYQISKFEAEAAVVESMRDIPAAIFRLSSIIGDSSTGRVRQFNYVHKLLRLFPRNLLPVAPGDPKALIDLISLDWAIPALAYLFERNFVAGRVYHLCAGREGSLTIREIIDLTTSAFERHPIGRSWMPIRVPEFVSLRQYEAFVETRRRQHDKLMNELLRTLGYFLPHLGIVQTFENRDTMSDLATSGLQLPAVRDYYGKVVQYCLDTKWGRQTATGSAA
jgi:nucleoside-diphosphate-sugar epimerase